MPVISSITEFLDLVAKSGLATPDIVEEVGKLSAGDNPAQEAADYMVKQRYLTQWQTRQLMKGRHKGFFLGNYRILDLLGRGGASRVFLARHERMGQQCAIKVMPAQDVGSKGQLARFVREVQSVASLNHPNIIRAYDFDTDDSSGAEVYFFVMEYVLGESLGDLVKEGTSLALDDIVEYIRQAANGLHHAHERKLVHRDVKPANLLVNSQGIVKILDLGLVYAAGDPLTALGDDKVLGTVDFLAPEQARDSHDVDARADQYSLGCTFYFALTGEPPFAEKPFAERMKLHQTEPFARLQEKRPGTPENLQVILDRLVAKHRNDRYPTCEAVSLELGAWLLSKASPDWRDRHPSSVSQIVKQRSAAGLSTGGHTTRKSPRKPVKKVSDDAASLTDVEEVGSVPSIPPVFTPEQVIEASDGSSGLHSRDEPSSIIASNVRDQRLTDSLCEDENTKVGQTLALGVDLGASHARIAYIDENGESILIADEQGQEQIPSVIFFGDAKSCVGEEAVQAAEKDPSRSAIQNRTATVNQVAVGGGHISADVLTAIVLNHLKRATENKLGAMRSLVVATPQSYGDAARSTFEQSFSLVGLEVADFVNDTVATAICLGGHTADVCRTILVFDLGDRKLDVAVIRVGKSCYETIAAASDIGFGANHWDELLIDFLVKKSGVCRPTESVDVHALKKTAREIKHRLTEEPLVSVVLQHVPEKEIKVSQETFADRSKPLCERTLSTVNRALREAECGWDDIDELVLTGGGSKMPMIVDLLEAESNKPANCSLDSTSVARGAAIYAAGLGALTESPMTLKNVSGRDLSVMSGKSSVGKTRHVILPRNTPLPVVGSVKFVTQKEGQTNVAVNLVEGGDANGSDIRPVGRCVITGLPDNLPANTGVQVKFRYAKNGRLSITAILASTQMSLKARLRRPDKLSAEERQRWRNRLETGVILEETS